MAPKVKAILKPYTGRPPVLDDLGLGNRRTKYNELTWAKACATARKLDAATEGWQKLVPTLTISHGTDPYAVTQYKDLPDPCGPGAVKRALREARRLIEEDGNILTSVSGHMRYTAGGDQPRHHASWQFGGYAREGSMFAGAARRGLRRRR